jgi:hypothetical protein
LTQKSICNIHLTQITSTSRTFTSEKFYSIRKSEIRNKFELYVKVYLSRKLKPFIKNEHKQIITENQYQGERFEKNSELGFYVNSKEVLEY